MTLNLADLPALLRDTFTAPRPTMRRLLDAGLPLGAMAEALVLVAVISAILSEITIFLTPVPGGSEMIRGMAGGPLAIAVLQLVLLVLIVTGIDRVGRSMGGQGDLTGAIVVVVWMQVVMIALQLAQLVTLVLVPPLASLIGLLSIAVFFWMMSSFVAELHRFDSLGRVFAALLLGFVGLALVLTLILSLLGIAPPTEMM
jgi:hypothetical protein